MGKLRKKGDLSPQSGARALDKRSRMSDSSRVTSLRHVARRLDSGGTPTPQKIRCASAVRNGYEQNTPFDRLATGLSVDAEHWYAKQG